MVVIGVKGAGRRRLVQAPDHFTGQHGPWAGDLFVPAYIWMVGNGPDNLVVGNFIGTNAAATAPPVIRRAPGRRLLMEAGPRNRIGDETLAGRNVISGNSPHGVTRTTRRERMNNIVRNNIIGLSPDGTRRL